MEWMGNGIHDPRWNKKISFLVIISDTGIIPGKDAIPFSRSDTPVSFHEDTPSSSAEGMDRRCSSAVLKEIEIALISSGTVRQYFASCTLTIEEWKTEQQLFAKAVSVNLSETARYNVWLGSLDIFRAHFS